MGLPPGSDAFLVGHDKSYVVSVVFGAATDTDDCDGEVIRTGVVPDEVFDPFFASVFVGGLGEVQAAARRCTRPSRWGGPRPAMRLARGALSIWRARHRGVLRRASGHPGGADGGSRPAGTSPSRCRRAPISARFARDLGHSLGCPAHNGGAAPHGGRRDRHRRLRDAEVLRRWGARRSGSVEGARHALHLPRRCRCGAGTQRNLLTGRRGALRAPQRRSGGGAVRLHGGECAPAARRRTMARSWPLSPITASWHYMSIMSTRGVSPPGCVFQ